MSDFPQRFLEEMKPIALARIKGGVFRRLLLRPQTPRAFRRWLFYEGELDLGMKSARAAYFSAIHEAGRRMLPNERSAWLEDGTLPEGFWEWVDREAASWDALQ